MFTLVALYASLAGLPMDQSLAQALDPLAAPRGVYVVQTRSCTDQGIGALEMMEFDGTSIMVNRASCNIASARRSGSTFEASCAEPGSPPETTTLTINRPADQSLSINGATYKFCPRR
ncbi:hypothetical protein [Phreatobacter sp. AB_2022a]|uniref:hypothetical protein n=1 Tax=Phreatobacter sp. AB_2022a TaxID=3003134 RepID=UPI0022875450|nr:hypothetical protein [Phreatobacter sp. AB_2022a]MCZ0738167.1 hypothetical protein [Phreatobacter sp. AB_2022a]